MDCPGEGIQVSQGSQGGPEKSVPHDHELINNPHVLLVIGRKYSEFPGIPQRL